MRRAVCPPRTWPARLLLGALVVAGCHEPPPTNQLRLSGHVEATEVRIAPEVGGRLLELRVEEGSRVQAGDVVARLDVADTELAITRARAERDQADAQLRLLLAGSRPEDVRQAEAQVASARADEEAARAELISAQRDLARFEDLMNRNSGSRKQRDDAATRAEVAAVHVRGAQERIRAASEAVQRLKAGARRQEIDAARSRVASMDGQLAILQKAVDDATVKAPASGVITEKLAETGELIAARTTIAVLTDLDHAWANVYVDEPMVPRVRLGQPARVYTGAGGEGLSGTVSYVSPRAEFTPRNVQTAEERSKLVYRIKISVDNRQGVLKSGMPVEAELVMQPDPALQPPDNPS